VKQKSFGIRAWLRGPSWTLAAFAALGSLNPVPVMAQPTGARAAEEPNNNPDIPGFISAGAMDRLEYLKARADFMLERRGLPALPGGPKGPKGQAVNLRAEAIKEMAAAEQRIEAERQLNGNGLPPLVWTSVGPAPLPNGQTSAIAAPVSGRVSAIAVDPTDEDIVYVGAAQGGVYRSLDGGQTWTPIFDDALSLAIGAIAIAPSDPTIVYVGTGESTASGDSFAGVGLYRIENAKTTADLVGPINPLYTVGSGPTTVNMFTGRSVSEILVHPTDPATIFVASTSGVGGGRGSAQAGDPAVGPPLGMRGLYRSTNATAAAGTVAFTKLAVTTGKVAGAYADDTTGDRNIYDLMFVGGDSAKLVLSVAGCPNNTTATLSCNAVAPVPPVDNGIWRTLNAMDPAPTFTQEFVNTTVAAARTEFAQTADGTTLVAAIEETSTGTTCATPSGNNGAVRTSTDGGDNWSAKKAGGGGFCGGQCVYDIAVEMHPTNANRILIGGAAQGTCSRVYALSTDGGATFSGNNVNDVTLHADTHALAFAPSNNNVVYQGSDGGIWRSDDAGATWTSLNNRGFNATQFVGVGQHPIDRNFLVGGTQDNGTQWLRPDGNWWRADFGDGGFALIDQSSTNTTDDVTMYHTYFNQANAMGFARLTNTDNVVEGWPFFGCGFVAGTNGLNCSQLPAILFYAPIALGPGTPNTIYFGSDRLFRSADKGVTMPAVGTGPAGAALQAGVAVSAIGIAPGNDSIRLVGMRFGKVFGSTGNTVMNDVTGPWPTSATVASQPRRFVSEVAIHPTNPEIAFVAFATYGGNKIYGTPNLVTSINSNVTPTWIALDAGIPDVPVTALVIDPRTPTNMYAATDIGVYASFDGGNNWAPYGTGLPRVSVFDLVMHEPSGTLRAATHGRGLWEIRTAEARPEFTDLESLTVEQGTNALELHGKLLAGSVAATGSVGVTIGATTCYFTIDPSTGGFVAQFPQTPATRPACPSATASLAPGDYTITYTYAGIPGDFLPTTDATTSLSVVAELIPTTTTISAPAVTYPNDVTVTVTVASDSGTPTGDVTLYVNGGATTLTEPLDGSGMATFVLSGQDAGAYALYASYPGDGAFMASANAALTTVSQGYPTFDNAASPRIALGTASTVVSGTIGIAGFAPPGNVEVTIDGNTVLAPIFESLDDGLGHFSAAFNTSALPAGQHQILLVYPGSTNWSAWADTRDLLVSNKVHPTSGGGLTVSATGANNAAPYPSTAAVSGIRGEIVKVTVGLNDFSHTYPGDTRMLLVGPTGKKVQLMAFAGDNPNAVNADIVIDDDGAVMPFFGPITSFNYKPTDYRADYGVPEPVAGSEMPAPAPGIPYESQLATFKGTNPNGTWSLYWRDDFNGDNGSIASWTLNIETTEGNFQWVIGDANDFNADTRPDILWRNQTDGSNVFWLLNGVTVTGNVATSPLADVNWEIAGTGRFNGDTNPDIFWRNLSTGDNAAWFMTGTTVSGVVLGTGLPDLNWKIGGTADFNGDNNADVVWRNVTTGDNAIWYMSGASSSGVVFLPAVTDLDWKIATTGDFNADGQRDILWQNALTGQATVWFMSGATVTGLATITSVPDTNWVIVGSGDFDVDGKTDVVWRNLTTGQNAVWYLNGTTVTSVAFLPPVAF
jgi:subtilisin-like proprotein convertase family protein